MIRVLPEEFNLKNIKQLRYHVKGILEKPNNIYKYQATINPKHQTKMMRLEQVVSKEPPVLSSYWEAIEKQT